MIVSLCMNEVPLFRGSLEVFLNVFLRRNNHKTSQLVSCVFCRSFNGDAGEHSCNVSVGESNDKTKLKSSHFRVSEQSSPLCIKDIHTHRLLVLCAPDTF